MDNLLTTAITTGTTNSSRLPPLADDAGESRTVTQVLDVFFDVQRKKSLKFETQKILPIHEAQLIKYLRLSGKRLGLLINFNEKPLENGIWRIAL